MKTLMIALMFVLISGCSTIEKFGDYVSENKLITSIAARQAVGRYIAAGDTIENENYRAERVISILNNASSYLSDDSVSTIDTLIDTVNKSIDWDKIETSDRLLIDDILALLKSELKKRESSNQISENTKIAILDLFTTAISAARVYLMR